MLAVLLKFYRLSVFLMQNGKLIGVLHTKSVKPLHIITKF